MDTMWLVLIALALGLIVGGGFVALISLALRRGERAATVVSPVVPDGVDQVLEALDSAGIVVDPSNNVLKASPGAFALGLVRDRVLASPELMELSLEVRRTGAAVTSELDLALGRFGEATRHLSVRAAPLGSRFILLLAEDHTEARRLDEVRRDFIANISHELKTPIGAIGLLSEALDTAADDPDRVKRFASRLATESQRLTRMTAEIIDLSRLQAADALHQPELVRVDRVIAAAVDQNRVPAEATGVALSVRGGKDLEVYGDEAMLVVAVHNLISNAIHYSPTGSQVGVGVRAVDDVVEVAITDQGVGIADEDRDRVFERFFRVDQARSRHTGGTGLGLSIVKHTVQNHGGEVKVWSQLGRGSTFTIRLPRATTPPEDLATGTARSTT